MENSASKPQWIGYAANAVAGERTVCSGNYGDGGGTERGRCALESEQEGWGDANGKKRGAAVGALKLEGNRKLIRYMFHVKQHFEELWGEKYVSRETVCVRSNESGPVGESNGFVARMCASFE